MCALLDDNSIVADPSSPVKSVACETMSLPPPHVVQEVEHYQSQEAMKEQEVTQLRPPMVPVCLVHKLLLYPLYCRLDWRT